MKRILLSLLSIILLLSVTACSGSSTEPQASASASASSTVEPTITPQVSVEPTIEQVSPTTGLPGNTSYKPVAVMIENSSQARPQTGMQSADIVYEAPVESSITRFMCIFNDNYPEVVGPVRSARIYFIKLQQEWDSVFANFGGPDNEGRESYIYGAASSHIKVWLNGILGKYSSYFWRATDREAPHNVYTNIKKDAAQLNYTPKPLNSLTFSSTKDYGAETATRIGLPFYSSNKYFVEYNYDSQKDVYVRSMEGKKFIDRATGNAIEAKNLIVQYADVYIIPNDGGGRRNVKLVGEGKAEYFIGGKHITGTWKKSSFDSGTVYLDNNGQPIELRPGNTWIHIHPNTSSIVYK